MKSLLCVILILAATPSFADFNPGPLKQNDKCWKASKSADKGTFGYWMPCVEKAVLPSSGSGGMKPKKTF